MRSRDGSTDRASTLAVPVPWFAIVNALMLQYYCAHRSAATRWSSLSPTSNKMSIACRLAYRSRPTFGCTRSAGGHGFTGSCAGVAIGDSDAATLVDRARAVIRDRALSLLAQRLECALTIGERGMERLGVRRGQPRCSKTLGRANAHSQLHQLRGVIAHSRIDIQRSWLRWAFVPTRRGRDRRSCDSMNSRAAGKSSSAPRTRTSLLSYSALRVAGEWRAATRYVCMPSIFGLLCTATHTPARS